MQVSKNKNFNKTKFSNQFQSFIHLLKINKCSNTWKNKKNKYGKLSIQANGKY